MIVQIRREQAERLLALKREADEAQARLNAALGVILTGIAHDGAGVERVYVANGVGYVEAADALDA